MVILFFSIYEITVQFQDIERFSNLSNLNLTGYKVNGIIKSSQSSVTFGFPYINENGNGYITGPQNNKVYFTPIYVGSVLPYSSNPYGGSLFLTAKFDINKTNAFLIQNTEFNNIPYSNISVNVKDYNLDSFYREEELIIGANNLGSNIYSIFVNSTMYRFGIFDENDNFTAVPVNITTPLKITYKQSWSTDRLQPLA